ncbi:hypothetical protein LTR70_006508 [Exophiala xenobiotica]|uniref:ABM domain-containing protein n=1 Tax=Lithohypha guttulata TaxID=1690604 RepID=A0ABR0JXP6_9EURO|nr:hypothetical protein LTR24_009217 [Lithohypha guttulata]KAK5315956.1 hypothetical protein LTR70_006508 [Exophiala xenobiotica]
MAIINITHIEGSPSSIDKTIQKAVKSLQEQAPRHLTIGTQIQDPSAVQITSEWASPNVDPSMGRSFHVALNRSAFGPDGPATANVVEFAQSYFSASRVTPEFQKQIEQDFLRFDEICSRGAEGDLGLAFGWVQEEQQHEEVVGEEAKCFLVIRGWESMAHFERLVKHDAYKEAIPILFAWKVPFKMWHVERKFPESSEISV